MYRSLAIKQNLKRIPKCYTSPTQVTLDKMDALVNESAALPRKLGFAPKNEAIYGSDDQRKAARYFQYF